MLPVQAGAWTYTLTCAPQGGSHEPVSASITVDARVQVTEAEQRGNGGGGGSSPRAGPSWGGSGGNSGGGGASASWAEASAPSITDTDGGIDWVNAAAVTGAVADAREVFEIAEAAA
mgnify:CR=1 FL=1